MKKIKNRYTGEIMCGGKSLQEIIALHNEHLNYSGIGKRADLTGAVLTGDRFKWRNHTRFSCRPEGEKTEQQKEKSMTMTKAQALDFAIAALGKKENKMETLRDEIEECERENE